MAQTTGTATYWNTINLAGLLYTADVSPGQNGTGTPFLTLIGGLNGPNAREVADFDYAMSAEYDFPAPAQPAISETASETAATAVSPQLTQSRNTCQIFQESVNITYKKLSTTERIATQVIQGSEGYWAPDGTNNQDMLYDKHVSYSLAKMARDANTTFLNGTFNQSTNSGDAAKTRGIITGITSSSVDASSAALSPELLQELFKQVVVNSGGQTYRNTPILFLNALQKQRLSAIYAYQPNDWNVGGVSIDTVFTDFGRVGVIFETMIPTNTILLAAMNMVKPVFCPYEGERIFEETLAKTGAARKGQLYSQMGVDYANESLHGKIINLAIV